MLSLAGSDEIHKIDNMAIEYPFHNNIKTVQYKILIFFL